MSEMLVTSQEKTKVETQKVNLLNDLLPEEAVKKLSRNWDIPGGEDGKDINSSERNQIHFLLGQVEDNLTNKDEKVKGEAGRILSYLRDTLADPNKMKDSKDPSVLKKQLTYVERLWTKEGGEKAYDLFVNQWKKEKAMRKEQEKVVKPAVGQMWEINGEKRRIMEITHEGGQVRIRVSRTNAEKEKLLIGLLRDVSNVSLGYSIKTIKLNKLEDLIRGAKIIKDAGVISQQQIDRIINEPVMNGLQLKEYLKKNDPDFNI